MPSHITDHTFGQAIVDSVYNGSYPESEEVVSAELPQSALPTILELIDQAREDVKKIISRESKDLAPDVDGWISQAKHLQDDIEGSKKTSQDIVNQAAYGDKLQNQVDDATQKVHLLHGEVDFNRNLVATLEKIQELRRVLGLGRKAVQSENLDEAVDYLLHAERELATLPASQITKVTGLLLANVAEFRHNLVGDLKNCWKTLFRADFTTSTFSVTHRTQRTTTINAGTIIDALSKLNLLDQFVKLLYEELDFTILKPRLKPEVEGSVQSLQVEDNEIKATKLLTDFTMQKLFSDMHLFVGFLYDQLPSSVSMPLSELLIPRLNSLLISHWLSLNLPTDVKAIQDLKDVLGLTIHFADTLDSYRWCGKDQLVSWANSIPQVWLNKRRGVSLDEVRRLLAEGLGESEAVERVETQMLSHGDDVFADKRRDDDWNADWSDDEEADLVEKADLTSVEEQPEHGDEEGVNAWGFDDDTNNDSLKEIADLSGTGNDEADAWGWKDEAENDEAAPPEEKVQIGPEKSNVNGHPEAQGRPEKEITLKETYNITALPKQMFEVITQLIFDAEVLRSPIYKESPIASTVGGLFSLPGLILSMYRAIAPSFYSLDPSGSMFLYNDSLWLAESLRQFTGTQFKQTGQINPGAAEVEICALETFAKRTYSKEMESQRTILGDLLDGAQGFANCTQSPFAQECDIAVSSVVDRLREVHRQWRPVLSHSALLQSIGSLLSTVAKKFIVDIEDMSDISEPESHRLAAFCASISSLEDLFTPLTSGNSPAGEAPVIPLTAVYTPNWLKFQYLANILESSLVDIKYLWTEGELRLEFEAEELVDLIEALFADSEHRRRAIGEIRRL